MNATDRETILAWTQAATREARLVFHPSDAPQAREMQKFLDELSGLAPEVTVKREDPGMAPAPSIRLGNNLYFQTVPSGLELAPFLAALSGEAPALPGPVAKKLATLPAPAWFTVFVMPGCPHCPRAVLALLSLALESPRVRVTVVDGLLFPEKAAAFSVKSAPTVFLDGGGFSWTGAVDPGELAAVAADRDPALLGPDSLKAMTGEGEAEKLARLMADAGKFFPAFLDIAAHPLWSVRLGAMAAFEHLAALAPDLAAAAGDLLWERFLATDDTQAQGDLLYLLGQTGRADLIPRLEQIRDLSSRSAEVREAAADALEELAAARTLH
ncbi:MAG: thioredoxin family protein [Proteobacteria bacterium]|nr:thioredoxin family protein [Pseudomonadota bacterium]